MDLGPGENSVAAAFPVGERDELVLVTDGGQLIRVGVGDIRIARRSTRGVRIFNVSDGERVVSVTRLAEAAEAPDAEAPEAEAPDAAAGRSEEHTSELQSLMRISYAVFCLKKTKTQ